MHVQQFPRPPSISNNPDTPLEISHLRALIDYAQKIIDYGPATTKTRTFCRSMVTTTNRVLQLPDGTSKKEALETIRTQMDYLISKFNALEGPNGLVANLNLAAQGAIDTRLLLDYGDYYLAATAKLLRDQSAWQPLKTELFENFEEEMELDEKQCGDPYIPNEERRPLKYIRACQGAAIALGWPLDIVNVEIGIQCGSSVNWHFGALVVFPTVKFTVQTYALRNRVCHSGLKVAIEKGDYSSAAKRIVMDRRFLRENCASSDYQAMMLRCIDVAAREYFQREKLIGDVPIYTLQPQHQARYDAFFDAEDGAP